MSHSIKRNPMLDTRRFNSLRELVDQNAELWGDKPVYVYKKKREKQEYSYRQLKNNSDAIGTAIAKMGLCEKNIAVMGEAHPAFMTTFYAVANSGSMVVPLDKELSDEELLNFLKLSESNALVWMPGQNSRMEKLLSLLNSENYHPILIPVEMEKSFEGNEQILPYEDWIALGKSELAKGNRDYLDREIDITVPCEIIFTSGTTGTSKGVLLSQKNLCTCAFAAASAIDYLKEGMRLVSVLPMNHTYEVTCSHLASQFFGTVTYLNESLKYVSKNIRDFKPDVLVLVPLFVETIHKKIWDEIRKKGLEKKVHTAIKISSGLSKIGIDVKEKFFKEILDSLGGSLKHIICGGAAVNPQLITDFAAFGISIQEGFGITECSPLVAVNLLGKERLRSVGPAVLGCQVRIDKETPDAETGEIVVKGDNVMLGYYRNEEATREAFTDDGWFKTGDIGYTDKDGYIYITGRKKNVIILSNGKNIFPEELEEHLGKSNLILECAVIGRKRPDGETVITALIFPDADQFTEKTADEISAQIHEEVNRINRHLPQYKQIREVEIRETEFEKTPSRKIKRYKLQ